jgi:hypothetical protein
MLRLPISALALVGIPSAPAYLRSPPAAFPNEGRAECKWIKEPGVEVSLQ